METMNIEVPCISMSAIKKTLKGIGWGKTGGADGLSIDLINDPGDFLLEKLAKLSTNYSTTERYHQTLKTMLRKHCAEN